MSCSTARTALNATRALGHDADSRASVAASAPASALALDASSACFDSGWGTMADRPAHLAAPAPDSASPGVHARPVLSSCVACKMANPRIELVPRPDPRGSPRGFESRARTRARPGTRAERVGERPRAGNGFPDDPPRDPRRGAKGRARATRARASAKVAGSSCARSSSTVLISSERPGTPGWARTRAERSRTPPGETRRRRDRPPKATREGHGRGVRRVRGGVPGGGGCLFALPRRDRWRRD